LRMATFKKYTHLILIKKAPDLLNEN
jgi:hypothetical protein